MNRRLPLAPCVLALASCQSRGWVRETGSRYANPPGYFRGLEREGPVALTDVPVQVQTMEQPRR